MKKTSKIVALLLSMVMVFALAACGGKDKPASDASKAPVSGDSSKTEETSSKTDDAASGDVVTLKWAMVGNGMPSNYEAWAEKVNSYMGEKIGVNIDLEVVSWGDWSNRRSVIVKTGGDYDILFTNGDTYTSDVKTNAFADLTDIVETASPELYSSIPANYWDACRVDGKIYGVPTYKDSSQTNFIVWDKELAASVGIDTASINTLDAMTEPLQKITDKISKPAFPIFKSGATWVYYEYDNMSSGLPAIGVRYDDASTKVVPVFEQDDIMKDLTTLHQWYQSGIINSDAATLPEDASYKAVQIAQGWSGAAKTTWGPNMGVEAEAYQIGEGVISNDTVRGSLNAISANCENPEKALEFLQLINTDSYVRDSFYYGLEGDDWDYTADNKVHRNKTDWSMAGYTQASFFTVTQTDDVDFNQWDEVKTLNEKATPSVLVGFTFDTTKVSDQLANCVSIYERYKGEVLTGTTNPEESIPAMMAEMRDAGFDEIVTEAQTQVDAFIASK
ncbi:ABC transporter substrate-binding protein [Scatolibacter rhodanostii]|uniref:ABC transporter substrate-binding protein n=1 Tax=Scatolibacter rhodanostii TaxID=2014781 RepID=UPI0013566329|nr:ABC transporter substrate-binding protein [Scatolibacter rhodanostii]